MPKFTKMNRNNYKTIIVIALKSNDFWCLRGSCKKYELPKERLFRPGLENGRPNSHNGALARPDGPPSQASLGWLRRAQG
jgi:hypothetical protein